MLKPMGEGLRSIQFYILSMSTHKTLTDYNGQNSHFAVEKPGRHHLKRVVKINISSNGTT